MKMKKLLLGLGTLAAVAAPVAAVVACGVDESKVNYVFDKNDKVLAAAIKAAGGALPSGTTLEANEKALDGTSNLEERFVAFEITQTKLDSEAPTNAFSKGSAVQLIKTVVQYLNDMDVKSVTKFDIKIKALKVVATTTGTGDAKKVTNATPTSGYATLSITLTKTEIKDLTEKLVDIKASNKSTPKDLIKAEKFSIK